MRLCFKPETSLFHLQVHHLQWAILNRLNFTFFVCTSPTLLTTAEQCGQHLLCPERCLASPSVCPEQAESDILVS